MLLFFWIMYEVQMKGTFLLFSQPSPPLNGRCNVPAACTPMHAMPNVTHLKPEQADNPNPMPTQGLEFGTSPLSGDWRLVYTNALDVLTVALVPAVAVGQVYQNINGDASEITNVIDLQPSAAPLLNAAGASTVARLKVKASGKVESGTRVAIKFISSEFSPRTFLGQEVSGLLPAPRFSFPQVANPIGWIENTYVDDSLRVCRAIGDNVFVLTRVSDYDE
mmetsp:Transcript_16497/g.29161  ORF Transcript_16497/g.29161 Transcript_16497/m.29161 type:complete len:221 (-) Transcript_16497:435-1097(-)